MDTRRILVVMPHPDDMEILCAGTLMRLVSLGFELHTATMTPGDKGSATLSPDEIATIRREEARKGAETVGAKTYTCLEFKDLEIVFDNPTRAKLAGLLRDVNPDIVFTTPPNDYMFDHEITSHLVRDACFNAAVKNYPAASESPPCEHVPALFYSEPIGGTDLFGNRFPARFVVDISAQMERKVTALACHDSQRAWLQKQHGMDNYIESMKAWAASRGEQIGVAYAEGFLPHLGHPYPHDPVLVSLLNATQP